MGFFFLQKFKYSEPSRGKGGEGEFRKYGWTRGLEEGQEREQGRSWAAVFPKTVQQADRKAYAMMPHRTLLFWGEPPLVTAVISQWLIRPPGSLALGHRAGTTPQLHSLHEALRRDFYASMVLPNSQDSNEKCILFYFSKIFQLSILCSAFYTPSSQCPPQRPGSLLSFRVSLYIGIQVQASFLSVSPPTLGLTAHLAGFKPKSSSSSPEKSIHFSLPFLFPKGQGGQLSLPLPDLGSFFTESP